MKLPKSLLLLFIVLFASEMTAQESTDDSDKRHRKSEYSPRYFHRNFWALGLYAGTENFETMSFGINFPLSNQNMEGKLFERKSDIEKLDKYRVYPEDLVYSRSGVPKRLALNLGVERNFSSLVYRPEAGLVFTPFSLLFKTRREGIPALNHFLISTEYLPPIRNYNSTYRFGAGYMIRLKTTMNPIFRSNAVRFYFLYHYNLSKDWNGHLFTLQINYNREPFYPSFNPSKTRYKSW